MAGLQDLPPPQIEPPMNGPFASYLKTLIPRRDSFAANVLTLVGGGALANLIIFAASPILTRLYDPKDFGLMALFVSITIFMGGIASWRYEMAIMLPRENQQAAHILWLCITIITGVSGLSFLLVVFCRQTIADLIKTPELSPWLWWAPLTIFLTGLFNAFHFWCTRNKKFHLIATSKVGRSLGIVGPQLGVGLTPFAGGAAGLIAGQVIGQAVGTGILVRQVWQADGKLIRSSLSKSGILKQTSRHKKFALWTSWAFFANNLATQIPVWFIASSFGTQNAGFFAVAKNATGLSISMIALSIAKVFYQRAAEVKNRTGSSYPLAKKTFLALAVIAAPPFIALMLWGPEIFSLVFGKTWATAGKFAALLSPLNWCMFVVGPLNMITAVHEAQEISFFWQFGLFTLTAAIFYLTAKYQLPIDSVLFYYVIIVVFWYLFNLFVLFQISKGKPLFKKQEVCD
jgi:O-antigen/teichoic acid export membrane protein